MQQYAYVATGRTDGRKNGRTRINQGQKGTSNQKKKIKMRMIPVISVKQQGRLYRRGVPRAMSTECESYLRSAVWLMVCEQSSTHTKWTYCLTLREYVVCVILRGYTVCHHVGTDGRMKCNNTCNTNTSTLVVDVSLSIAWITRIPCTRCNNTVQLPQRL